jgi:2-polyprenyl-3-methyl-5-hydroxy-6-metoxy-1,4-benzoquinol methylase
MAMRRRFANRRSVKEIARRKAEIVERYGEWTAHNIQLADGLYTRGPEPCGDETKLRCAVQLIADATGRPFSELRIADLGCLEGMYAAEFGLRGSEVLGVEGREANIAKAVFACETLGLPRVRFVQDDVRNFSREKYGSFDAVVCWGLLYHLDAPDVFAFLESLAGACSCCAVIDTHVSFSDQALAELPKDAFWWAHPTEFQSELSSFTYRGRKYWGREVPEHLPETTLEQRLESSWASLDNVNSFWLTFESLVNALVDAGFTSVARCWAPVIPGQPIDRVTLVASRSERSGPLRVTPQGAEEGPWRVPEPDTS